MLQQCVERDMVQIRYNYDLTDDEYCMPLCTEGVKTVIAVKIGALIVFSICKELVQSGKKGIRWRDRSMRDICCQYTDTLEVYTQPLKMDYAQQRMIPRESWMWGWEHNYILVLQTI